MCFLLMSVCCWLVVSTKNSLPATLCVFGVHVSWRSRSESHFINFWLRERGNVTLNFRNKRKRKGEMGFLHCVPSHGSNGDDIGKVLCCSVKLLHYSNGLPVDFRTKILLLLLLEKNMNKINWLNGQERSQVSRNALDTFIYVVVTY